jgi:hypothetical protein
MWEGPRGGHYSDAGLSMTFSGERIVNFNVAVCHGPDPEITERALAKVVDTGLPSLIMLAGPALGAARTLCDAGWLPVQGGPMMKLSLGEGRLDESVRRLDMAGLETFRSVVEETYGLPPSAARIALPDTVAVGARHSESAFAAWGLYDGDAMVSGVATSTVADNVCIWLMATPPGRQRRGHGRHLLMGVLAQCAHEGAQTALLIASAAGEALYLSMGFEVVEYWQVWSRARWVI